MMKWETAIIVVLGVMLGSVAALGTLVPFSHAMTGSMWPSMSPSWALVIVAATALVAGIGTMVPARLALRSRPVESIGARQ
jgi:putative ABC transport system permease protein